MRARMLKSDRRLLHIFTKEAVGLPNVGWFRAESAIRWIVHNCALHLACIDARACLSGTDVVKTSVVWREQESLHM